MSICPLLPEIPRSLTLRHRLSPGIQRSPGGTSGASRFRWRCGCRGWLSTGSGSGGGAGIAFEEGEDQGSFEQEMELPAQPDRICNPEFQALLLQQRAASGLECLGGLAFPS